MIKVRLGDVVVVSGECYITLGKLIGLSLSIVFLKTPKIQGMNLLAL